MTDFIDLDGEEAKAPKPLSGGDSHGAPTGLYESPRVPSDPARGGDVPPEVIGQGAEYEPRRRPLAAPQRHQLPQRTMPASEEAEQHVIACCLIDDGLTLKRAHDAGLTQDSFYWPQNQIIFAALTDLAKAGKPLSLEVLAEELTSAKTFDQAGGFPYLMQVTAKVPTTAHAGYFIDKVAEAAEKRALIRNATGLIEAAYRGEDAPFLRKLAETVVPKGRKAADLPKPKAITDYAYPSDDDPNMLLGSEDYLGRGGGLLFVSHAGAGKSSWAMGACMMWALGRAWMGIRSHKPRKTLIVQAEDSDRYIGKIFTSFAHVNKLTPDELALLKANCVIVRLKGVSGPAFFTALSAYVDEHQPDLVVINPIYLYAEGDITRSEYAQPFLLGLDSVNRAEKFAYILIHHTGKPQAKGNNGKRAEVEDWESAYMGFGSSYLANWPRATILLEPVAGQPGSYQIKLGKGGYNAGVTREVEQGVGTRQEPCTRIAIRHSRERMDVNGRDRPVFYWEIDPDQPEPAAKGTKHPGGREAKNRLVDFEAFFPKKGQPFKPWAQIWNKAKDASGIARNSFRDMCDREWKCGLLERFVDDNVGVCYRLNTSAD